MDLTLESAKLSVVVYDTTVDDTGYASLQVFNHEPDQALVARTTNGYCFGVFRGTTKTISDWSQNFDPRKMPICESDSPEECCETRKGFYDAYFAEYWSEFEKALGDCASQCENADECVVLSGHRYADCETMRGNSWLVFSFPFRLSPLCLFLPILQSRRFYCRGSRRTLGQRKSLHHIVWTTKNDRKSL